MEYAFHKPNKLSSSISLVITPSGHAFDNFPSFILYTTLELLQYKLTYLQIQKINYAKKYILIKVNLKRPPFQ